MDYLERNRRSWNDGTMSTSAWARPVDEAAIAQARAGRWQVFLTPRTPVPKAWFPDIVGKGVLCLASGGGQQVPILAAAGAIVVSFDLSDEQLRKDQMPAVLLFDHDEADETGELVVRHSLPYSDEESLPPDGLSAKAEAGEPFEFSHSLTSQIGGQTQAGFVIADLYEDHWHDDSWPFSNRSPVCIATRAIRPP